MTRHAFTLLELLIVMSLIALLAGMAMPMVATAQRAAKRSNTQSIMRTVENGLGMFRMDIGIYPYHSHATTATTLEPNRLGDVLAWHVSDAAQATQRANLAADLLVINAANAVSPQVFDNTYIGTWYHDPGAKAIVRGTLNKMANERARLAFLAGHVSITGARDATKVLVSAPKSSGWQHDYLSQDLASRCISGSSILDAYGSPLLYVCKAIPTSRPVFLPDSAAINDDNQVHMQNQETVVGSQHGMPAITRDVTASLDSDVRKQAAAAFVATYELWSAGRDGQSAALRNEVVNRDDVLAGPYRNDLR